MLITSKQGIRLASYLCCACRHFSSLPGIVMHQSVRLMQMQFLNFDLYILPAYCRTAKQSCAFVVDVHKYSLHLHPKFERLAAC